MKRALGWSLMILGIIPSFIWMGFAVYMFYIGPRVGWLSDEFFRVEELSFLWAAGMFAGIGVAALGSVIIPGNQTIEKAPKVSNPKKP